MDKTEQNKTETKKRVLYFDMLNICATLGVVFLHTNGIAHTYSNTAAWFQALAIEVLFYWPVPIFFMLSGATLMNYRSRYTTAEFFKKRFIRTVIPFVVWTLLTAAVKRINPLVIGEKDFINRCFNTSIENVYWFFIPLFAIYIAMPVISRLKDERGTLWYMFGSAFLLNSFLPFLFSFVGLKWNYSLSMPVVGGCLLFAILGYLLATTEFDIKKRIVTYCLGIFGILLRYTATVFLSVRDGVINKTFFGYSEFFSVFLAVAVFVLFKESKIIKKLENNKKAARIISKLSGCSFGVYLIHMFILRLFLRILPLSYQGFVFRLAGPVIIYLIAVSVVFVLKKIPVIKYIVP